MSDAGAQAALGWSGLNLPTPHGLDATNDLPKSHPLYLAAAGLVETIDASDQAVAASGWFLEGSEALTIPADRTGFLVGFTGASSGKVSFNFRANYVNITGVMTPDGGGTVSLDCSMPIIIPGGQTCGVQVLNIDASGRTISYHVAVAIL